MSKVKNKAAAELQISAEQLLLEAYERRGAPLKTSEQTITDPEELREYQGRKRTEYENALRRNRLNPGQWMRYAQWELDQRQFDRARSVFERALDVDPTSVPLWVRYIQSELKERNINHARNLFDRAVTLLPRVDKLWFLYVQTEETLSNIDGCRAVFERWMAWKPDVEAWNAYIKMETRYQEYENVRNIFERYVVVHPQASTWIKWARFEDERGNTDTAREIFTAAVDTAVAQYGSEFIDQHLLIAFAKWEARGREWERARALYRFGLERLPKSKSRALYEAYTKFEKQYGDSEGIEGVVLSKRRLEYEEKTRANPQDYDAWVSHLQLLEDMLAPDDTKDLAEIRDVFERAVANVPPDESKTLAWRRYIYLWIRYALYEELDAQDIERARQVYQQALKIIPHQVFSFAKLWLLYAKFELRHSPQLTTFRKILGQALGKSGKPKLYKEYIELEKRLKEFERCRVLYNKYIEAYPQHPNPWIEFATLEQHLGDVERARAIYELAIAQPALEMPELVWKKYIEFETEEEQYDRARLLYERLLSKAPHLKVWVSYAGFELMLEDIAKARAVFERAWTTLQEKEDRVVLHESWAEFEQEYGDDQTRAHVEEIRPSVIRKRRALDNDQFEEYLDYVFPSDAQDKPFARLLANARRWKEAS